MLATRMRPETRFLLKFFLCLAVFFALSSPRPMDRALVTPFTSGIAEISGAAGRALGLETRHVGTALVSPAFSVDIRNGCNGLETWFLFAAAVLAFPARPREKALGLAIGLVAIQLVNVARILVLFALGVHAPALFQRTHAVVAPAVVIVVGVGLFLAWALRVTRRGAA